MNIDDLINVSLKDKSERFNISEEKYDMMLQYIETEAKAKKCKFTMLNKFKKIFSKPYLGYLAEVVILIIIFFFIPLAVKNYKDINQTVVQNNTTLQLQQKNYSYDFIKELRGIVQRYDNASLRQDITTKEFTDINEVKEKVPFNIQCPNFLPDGYKFKDGSMRTESTSFFTMYSVIMNYSKSDMENVFIVENSDTGKENLDGWEKISINGIDAWIRVPESPKPNIQIVLWNGGKYYNFISDCTGRDNLIKIACSIDYSKDINPKETVCYTEDMSQIKEKLPFEIKLPKYMSEGYKQNRTMLSLKTVDKESLYFITTVYSKDIKENIEVSQVNETVNPDTVLEKYKDEINKLEKLDLNGIDAWVYESRGDSKKYEIIFSKYGRYFMVSGDKQHRDELINVAKSI
ncbi:DUF4367 domain-containing protein [Clostridium sp. YIM B02515]|uniref:DUF4367 domain-containing protein n=1 Tax=Clostridium rhizosphaerae TaxID=2803861 RepID=A0ABS1TCU0_9CLOT|nr:DUF4367 domain-containing protein [Clostridium rhizosphaerae]MBL4936927.1 DUF4367 domain-containing protein [Clostridium rhizosphaerae]